jgi:endogenous inhibitor of DNA gyrase (YacG/DUF329 family)
MKTNPKKQSNAYHCPKCGKKITWFNDIPLKGFCWGTSENEHEEYSVKVQLDELWIPVERKEKTNEPLNLNR